MAPPNLLDDLNAGVEEVVAKFRKPLEEKREAVVEALAENKNQQRALEAQLERIDAVLATTKIKRRAGRPAGSGRRQRTPAAATA